MQKHFQNHASQIKQLNNQKLSSQIKQLSNENLLSQTKFLVQKERDVHIQILHHLAEIDSRKLYFSRGFSSLFDYAVRELGYSEGAAYRRIKAMKLCRDMPETENRLQSGRLSLSTACQLQVFFEKQARKAREQEKRQSLLLESTPEEIVTSAEKEEMNSRSVLGWVASAEKEEFENRTSSKTVHSRRKQEQQKTKMFEQSNFKNQQSSGKETHRFLNHEEKKNLVKKAEGCSTRATAKLLSEKDPSLSLPQEKTRFLGKGKVEIKIVIDEKCHKRLEDLKNFLSHRNPALTYGELLSILSEEGLKRHDPGKGNIREKKGLNQKRISEQNRKKSTSLKEEVQEIRKEHEEPSTKKLEQGNKMVGKKVTSPAKERVREKLTEKATTSRQKSNHKINKISRHIPFSLRKYI